MIELTSEELGWQGLDAASFSRLDDVARGFVTKRAILYRRVKDKTLVAELLNVMATELPDKKPIVEVLEGRNRRGVEAVRIILRDFKSSGMQSIKDFYMRFYYAKADQILLGVRQDVMAGSNIEPKMNPPMSPPVGVPQRIEILLQEPDSQKSPDARVSDAEYIVSVPLPPAKSPPPQEERLMSIASEVSRWTNLPVGRVIKMDRDLLDRIIAFSDSNAGKGVTDKDVITACDGMLKDRKLGIQFPLEILTLHKDELLSRALSEASRRQ